MASAILGALFRLLSPLLNFLWGRRKKRVEATRRIEQLSRDVDECAAIFVADTQGGPVRQRRLPVDSAVSISALHVDGFLPDGALTLLREFFRPAEQANALLVAPAQAGPPFMNGAQRLACLFQGCQSVQSHDGNGFTLYERVRRELAEARERLSRP